MPAELSLDRQIFAKADYGLEGAFLVFRAAGFFTFISDSRPPISVRESVELNGNWRTDCWPVVLRVISTRRLLAKMMVREFRRTLARSSVLSSGFASTDCLTSSGVRLCCTPKALVSMLSAGTP